MNEKLKKIFILQKDVWLHELIKPYKKFFNVRKKKRSGQVIFHTSEIPERKKQQLEQEKKIKKDVRTERRASWCTDATVIKTEPILLR